MTNVKVSVIIPTYNAEKYISRCLNSLLNQSFSLPYEVIVSLNGCTDKTLDIVNEYSRKYNNLIIINNPNKLGAAKSRMAGIELAKGDYLMFADADDYVHTNYIKRLYDEALNGYDIVSASTAEIRGEKIVKSAFRKDKKLDRYGAIHYQLLDSYLRSFTYCKIFKASLFKEKIYYPKELGVIGEDTVMLYQLLNRSKRVKLIRDSLYFYDKNIETSITNSVNLKRFDQHINCFAFIRYLIDEEKDDKLLSIYRKTFWRTEASLWFDAHLLRKEFNHSAFKHLKLHKRELNLMKNKKPLPITGEVWEQYINDCLS